MLKHLIILSWISQLKTGILVFLCSLEFIIEFFFLASAVMRTVHLVFSDILWCQRKFSPTFFGQLASLTAVVAIGCWKWSWTNSSRMKNVQCWQYYLWPQVHSSPSQSESWKQAVHERQWKKNGSTENKVMILQFAGKVTCCRPCVLITVQWRQTSLKHDLRCHYDLRGQCLSLQHLNTNRIFLIIRNLKTKFAWCHNTLKKNHTNIQ